MQFFDRPRSRIALRGSSARPPTSQQLLADAKKAREARARLRAQHAAAARIQAAFRARDALRQLALRLNEQPLRSPPRAVAELLLLAGGLRDKPHSLRARVLHLSGLPSARPFLPPFVTRLAHALRQQHPHHNIEQSALVDAIAVVLVVLAHRIHRNSSQLHHVLPFCNDAIALVHLLASRLNLQSLIYQAASPLYIHIANLFHVIATVSLPPSFIATLVRTTNLTLQLLLNKQVPSNLSNLLYTQFALSTLSCPSFPSQFPLAANHQPLNHLIHALAYPQPPPHHPNLQWDIDIHLSSLSDTQTTIMLSNILHLHRNSWNLANSRLLTSLIMLVSSLLALLPNKLHFDELNELSDHQQQQQQQRNNHHQRSNQTLLDILPHHPIHHTQMNDIITNLTDSMMHIVSEDNVRTLMAAAVSQGTEPLIRVCNLFAFLLRKHPALTNSFQTALACWRRSNSASQPHILRSLWRICRHSPSHSTSPPNPQQFNLYNVITSETTPVLFVFSTAYSYLLYIQDADEMFDSEWPFSVDEVRDIATAMKEYLYAAIFVRPIGNNTGGTDVENSLVLRNEPGLIDEISRLLSRLYAYDSQRSFRVGPNFWLAGRGSLSSKAFLQDAIEAGPEALLRAPSITSVKGVRQASYGSNRKSLNKGAAELLRIAPFLIPFSSRAKIFQNWIAEERRKANGGESFFPTSVQLVSVRRNFIFEDAYQNLNGLGPALKSTIRVKFIDEHDIEEAGIDGGGVFKEFMHEVIRLGFSPYSYGLFKDTPDGRLYPNPDSPVGNENFKSQFSFLGRLLGKAVFDGVLVNIPLAQFFLSKMLGQFNYPIDMGSLDPELYKNLKFLKNCDPSTVEDLGLSFTIANNAYGSAREIELVKNGSNIPVTASNRIEYMHRVANYRMNTQIREQTEAFLKGFSEVVPSHFIRLFSHEELQLLISGKTGKIDLEDLRRNTKYSGGYDEDTAVIKWFWEVVEELTPEEQGKMLQFVTSSPRAPLLGFSYLVPSFCIHRAEGHVRLPTASTCMNLLKLPKYRSRDVVRAKVCYALESNAGFDLS